MEKTPLYMPVYVNQTMPVSPLYLQIVMMLAIIVRSASAYGLHSYSILGVNHYVYVVFFEISVVFDLKVHKYLYWSIIESI